MLVITLHNKSNLADISDYDYEVWVTARYPGEIEVVKKVIATGEVKQHNRADGWEVLVHKMLQNTGHPVTAR